MISQQKRQQIERVYQQYGVRGLLLGVYTLNKNLVRRFYGQYKRRGDEAVYQKQLAEAIIKDGFIEAPVNHYRMNLLANDLGISRDLIINGIREKSATQMMCKILSNDKNMTVLEIGANLGYYALLEATLLGKGSSIYAFEPHPENVRTLKENLKLNPHDTTVEVLQMAVSNTEGVAQLAVEESSNLHRIRDDVSNSQSIEVPTISVDKFCEKRGIEGIDLIRMDVEGFEVEIIEGAQKILRDSPNPIIFMEIHTEIIRSRGKNPISLLEQLEVLGFFVFSMNGHNNLDAKIKQYDWAYFYKNLPFLLANNGAHLFLAKKPGDLFD